MAQPIKCNVPGCGTTLFEIANGAMVFSQRHHGERHTVTLPLSQVLPVGTTITLPDGRTVQVSDQLPATVG